MKRKFYLSVPMTHVALLSTIFATVIFLFLIVFYGSYFTDYFLMTFIGVLLLTVGFFSIIYFRILLPIKKRYEYRKNKRYHERYEKLKNKTRERLNRLTLAPGNPCGFVNYQLYLFETEFSALSGIKPDTNIPFQKTNLYSLNRDVDFFVRSRNMNLEMLKEKVLFEISSINIDVKSISREILRLSNESCGEMRKVLEKINSEANKLEEGVGDIVTLTGFRRPIAEVISGLREKKIKIQKLLQDAQDLVKAEKVRKHYV